MSYREAESMMIDFAQKQSEIDAVYKGRFPRRDHPAYFFFIQMAGFNRNLESAVLELKTKIAQETDYACSLFPWPFKFNPNFHQRCIFLKIKQ